MECPSCRFQNMPGSARCARCGGLLALATTAIDVHPPRATAWSKSVAGLWQLRRLGCHLRGALRPARRAAQVDFEPADFSLPMVLRALVPGWPHLHTRRRWQGIRYAASYVCFLIPGLLMSGLAFGAMLLGVAFAIHTVSVVTALVHHFAAFRDRLLFTVYCGILLGLVLYLPAQLASSRFLRPVGITQPLPPYSAGDVIWYRPTNDAQPGQHVLYNCRAVRTMSGNVQLRVAEGLRINRIVAREGQTITWSHGATLVDGVAVPEPLPGPLASHWTTFTVPAGHVVINPANLLGHPVGAEVWSELALVPRERLLGVIFYQSWPLRRAGRLN